MFHTNTCKYKLFFIFYLFRYDYVEIYDGKHANSNNKIGRFCGNEVCTSFLGINLKWNIHLFAYFVSSLNFVIFIFIQLKLITIDECTCIWFY